MGTLPTPYMNEDASDTARRRRRGRKVALFPGWAVMLMSWICHNNHSVWQGVVPTEAFVVSSHPTPHNHRYDNNSLLPIPLAGMLSPRQVVRGVTNERTRRQGSYTTAVGRCWGARSDNEELDDDDDDEPPDVDIRQFQPPTTSFGWNRGRSSPSQRRGMGISQNSAAKVFVCTNCGAEYVQWRGQCPTCQSWNTLQEHYVTRQEQSSSTGIGLQPWFGSSAGDIPPQHASRSSWLDISQQGPTKIRSSKHKTDQNDNSSGKQRAFFERILIPADDEFNTVLGGGLVPGSLTFMGGSPGVGKSTLLLQVAADIANLAAPIPGIGMGTVPDDNKNMYGPVWYVSGEETVEQITDRADRLGLLQANEQKSTELYVWQETHVDRLCQQIVHAQQQQERSHSGSSNEEDEDNMTGVTNHRQQQQHPPPPSLLVIDSIQTMVCTAAGASLAGGITQVRECMGLLLRLAKSTKIPICVVGHVTKSGNVAGPKTVEHMVDCVLYLEGSMDSVTASDGMPCIRMLRATKNRFGSSEEVGVYSMTDGRLVPVSDPSALFLSHRDQEWRMKDVEGCAICIAMEGRRAVTMEIQALVTLSDSERYSSSRKTVHGIPLSRVQLLLGVLQKRCRLFFTRQDIYVNVVAGQLRFDRREVNSADLAVAVALVSSLTQIPVRADTAFCGEIGLLGELRVVTALEKRCKEAARMGFTRIITARISGSTSAATGRRSGGTRRNSSSSKSNQSSKSTATTITTTTKEGMEWIQCSTLEEALNYALVDPLPRPKRWKTANPKPSMSPPGSLDELELDGNDNDDAPIVLDDDDDDERYTNL